MHENADRSDVPTHIGNIFAHHDRLQRFFRDVETLRTALVSASSTNRNLPKAITEDLHELNVVSLQDLVTYACTHFAAAGSNLNLSIKDVPEKLHPASDKPMAWRPEPVWESLAAMFAGGGAADRNRKEAADSLVYLLNLDYKEPKATKSAMIFKMYAQCDDFARKWSQKNRYSYRAEEQFNRLLRALPIWFDSCTARSARPVLLEDGAATLRSFCGHNISFDAGSRIHLATGVIAIARIDVLELRIDLDLADDLSLFIGQHRSPARSH